MNDSQTLIPKSWEQCPIDDLLLPLEDGRTLHHGWSPQCETEPSLVEDEWGVLKTTSIQRGQFVPDQNKRLPNNLTPRPLLEVKPGDIVITCAGPRSRCGVPCLVRTTRRRLIISGKMYRFRVPEQHIEPRYLEAFLLSTEAQAAIDRMKTGISDSGLNLTHDRFRNLPVRVAPLGEQRRIVAEIEKQFTRLEAGVAALKRVQVELKRYRAALLKAACEGRLVPTEAELARREGRRYESAKTLLSRVKQNVGTAVARRAGRLWGAGVIPELTDGERASLPEGWAWAKVRDLGSDPGEVVQVGPMSMRSQDFRDDGAPVLNVGCVQWGAFDETKLNFLPETKANQFRRYRILPGDVLFTRSGAVGRCAVAKEHQANWLMTFHLLRVRVDSRFFLPDYLRIVFEGAPHISRQTRAASMGTTRAGFNTNLLAGLDVPIPPYQEQVRILTEVDRRLSEVGSLSTSVETDLPRSEGLRQAILKYAFEGKLVPQDPNDEPAGVLLERIRAERQTRAHARSGVKGQRRTKASNAVGTMEG
jgi:type I restriction enzyme, S subunit